MGQILLVSALLVPAWLGTVFSLGKFDQEYIHVGTGFLYAHPLDQENGPIPDDDRQYRFFLVTNKHVVGQGIDQIRFNHPQNGLTILPIDEATFGIWTFHPDGADIAVTPLRLPSRLHGGRELSVTDVFVADRSTTFAKDYQPVEGDGVFVIGFPLGLVGKARNYPIVRHGIVARIQDWIQRDEHTFLIDAPSFRGNSGGPVVLKPESDTLRGTPANKESLLAGVVSEQLQSQEKAIDERTGHLRVVFVEDTGLAEVVPVEKVRDTALRQITHMPPQYRQPRLLPNPSDPNTP